MKSGANKKHAYLIIAHNNFEQLQTLISLLDDERNDIYLHIDKKVVKTFPDNIEAKHSKIFFVKPVSVSWGGDTLIKAEMLLFKAAAPEHYMYYHLLSGLDLPLKTQNEIHAFFQEHSGENFMQPDKNAMKSRDFVFRTQHYYFFQNIVGRKKTRFARFLETVEGISLKLQEIFHLDRKEIMPLYKGAQWVSITDDLTQYLVANEKIIKKQFYHSFCGDEVFLISAAMYSPYRNTVNENYGRAIDWERGQPYTYRTEDVPELLASPALFARKFDSTVDAKAIDLIVQHLSNGKEN